MKRLSLFVYVAFILIALSACSNGIPNHEGQHSDNESTHESTEESIITKWSFPQKEQIQANQNELLRIEITTDAGEPVEDFDISHEKLLHLIIVSKDLSFFDHIHPEYLGKGIFEMRTPFPSGGEYKLIADFIPSDRNQMTEMEWVTIKGEAKKTVPIEPDTSLTKTVDGKRITLSFDSIKAGIENTLTFTIEDELSRTPITDLQPYLGAVGHVVILTEDTEQYLHVHPLDERSSGPEAQFITSFPNSGIYKIWGQFKHENKVLTIPFVIEVP